MPALDSAPLLLAGFALLGYLLGSIPFGIVITKAFGLGDLRKIGSGNIGATNVLRTGSKPAALATLILDAGKAAIAALAGLLLAGQDAAQIAGLAAFAGHLFPVWLRFDGGKGVATALGLLLALVPGVGLAAAALWIATFVITKISSLSALVACAAAPILALLFGRADALLVILAMVALIVYRHRPNISRLLAGTEPRFGARKDDG